MDVNTSLTPYNDNKSPTPKMDTALDGSGPISYNAFLDKSEPFLKPTSEPDSALSEVLKEPNDDFRLTIQKMSTAE